MKISASENLSFARRYFVDGESAESLRGQKLTADQVKRRISKGLLSQVRIYENYTESDGFRISLPGFGDWVPWHSPLKLCREAVKYVFEGEEAMELAFKTIHPFSYEYEILHRDRYKEAAWLRALNSAGRFGWQVYQFEKEKPERLSHRYSRDEYDWKAWMRREI